MDDEELREPDAPEGCDDIPPTEPTYTPRAVSYKILTRQSERFRADIQRCVEMARPSEAGQSFLGTYPFLDGDHPEAADSRHLIYCDDVDSLVGWWGADNPGNSQMADTIDNLDMWFVVCHETLADIKSDKVKFDKAYGKVCDMINNGFEPGTYILNNLLSKCGRGDQCVAVLAMMIDFGVPCDEKTIYYLSTMNFDNVGWEIVCNEIDPKLFPNDPLLAKYLGLYEIVRRGLRDNR